MNKKLAIKYVEKIRNDAKRANGANHDHQNNKHQRSGHHTAPVEDKP